MATDQASQIVYILTNPAMPGLIKIGKTTQLEVKDRMRQLYSTGVPVPFDCAYACKVKDATAVEKTIHYSFGITRINPNREFFKIEPDKIIAILKLLEIEEVTAQIENTIESDVTAADKQSAQVMKEDRRGKMNFHELGIPNDSILIFAKDPDIQVTVAGERKVIFKGEECSLSNATRQVLGLPEGRALQPSPYWNFNGKSVKEIYDEYHQEAISG